MRVELLYSEGCPNWRQALEDVNSVLKEYHVEAEVELIKVATQEEAEHWAFLGSPTIRIDDMDIELDIPDSGFNTDSRLYWVEDTALGRPPIEWIAAAVESALG